VELDKRNFADVEWIDGPIPDDYDSQKEWVYLSVTEGAQAEGYAEGARVCESDVYTALEGALAWASYYEFRNKKRALYDKVRKDISTLLEVDEKFIPTYERLEKAMDWVGKALGWVEEKVLEWLTPPCMEWIEGLHDLELAGFFKVYCGVYFLCQDKELVYIGQSTNIITMVGSHLNRRTVFDRVMFIEVEPKSLGLVSAALVRHLKPSGNAMFASGNMRTRSKIADSLAEEIIKQLKAPRSGPFSITSPQLLRKA
jgi:hypothetical protein